MTKEELIAKLKEIAKETDTEEAHEEADRLLIKFINDPEISHAFNVINKWYS